MNPLTHEKVDQAVAILNELEIDAWLTFVRETSDVCDPALPLIFDASLTWQSALLLTRAGRRIALVGQHDVDAVRSTGVWSDVNGYIQGIREPLREMLDDLAPRQLALNFSRDDPKADGLSHGMFELLQGYLDGAPVRDRIISAEPIIGALRGRKTPAEVARMRSAIDTTEDILRATIARTRIGMSEADLARIIREFTQERGCEPAWDPVQCPIVNTGPDSMTGHGIPSETVRVTPGHVLHIDFGVRQDAYCADLQRCWYVPETSEAAPPAEVQRAFDTVVRAIQTAAAVLRPGVEGWELDAAARRVVVEAGYPEYLHATGHHVGRAAHDGGGVLAPRWERYGHTPYRKVEPGNVFTLELGIENVAGRGYIGLEEMVLVTSGGCEWLSTPQVHLPVLPRTGAEPGR
jgi:Xaa-Pro dipeptidase